MVESILSLIHISRKSIKLGLLVALIVSLLQGATGHISGQGIAKNQPAKLAAFEGLYNTTSNAPLNLVGFVDEKNERVVGISLPYALSFMAHNDIRCV